MIRYLLDINVLIALIDPVHVLHDRAHNWFGHTGRHAWSTCPLTENGVLRIVGHPRYPGSPGTPSVMRVLKEFAALPGHAFWPDSVSILDEQHVTASRLSDSAQVTDTYLLALARAQNGRLATMDRRLITSAVAQGDEVVHYIAA